ncbi:hypothetical protein [Mariniplasma anaerobium]|uniref:Uncharacterized protein n=1 Tax=Mariniplasma anaerobium TaxID=2735436 RepID=A0A7U9XW76_9MOLU|nr:hypothetical protein [Mariniplasma anaerobium]BCR35952.1 hypothetical protein MPAN_008450 [Mariniplasma anaerobium]
MRDINGRQREFWSEKKRNQENDTERSDYDHSLSLKSVLLFIAVLALVILSIIFL